MNKMNPAYVAVGAVDFAAEKVSDLPGVKRLGDIKLTDGAKNLDTLQASLADVRTNVRGRVEEFASRGEKVVGKIEGRVDGTRKAVKGLRDDAVKTFEGFKSDPSKQLNELRTRVAKAIRPTKKATKSTTKAA